LPRSAPSALTIALLAALAIVLAFAGSAIFGLRGSSAERQTETVPSELAPAPVTTARGRVEVLNGAGKSGLARFATDRLRAAGFDVVQFGNAGHATDTSAVLDRVGNLDLATAVAQALEIANVRTDTDSSRLVDATVILGKDWSASQSQDLVREPDSSTNFR
jgi:hypothetical protein